MTEEQLVEMLKQSLVIELSRDCSFYPYRTGLLVKLMWKDVLITKSYLQDEDYRVCLK